MGEGTMEMESEPLKPRLDRAQKALERALDDACGVDLSRVDTGELIRIEESLVTASKAAKEAVSVRLRLREMRGSPPAQRESEDSGPADVSPTLTRRVFDDFHGKRWDVFAVTPSSATVEHGGL